VPAPEEIEAALGQVGVDRLELDPEEFTVGFTVEGMSLDLGAIGKGYAVERAAEILREHEVPAALVHGGTSSVYGLGAPPGEEGWKVGIRHPTKPEEQLSTVVLRDRALGVSAPHGKFFRQEGEVYGHVLDPRTGYPVRAALLAAVVTDSPRDADAMSTALLTLGEAGLDLIARYAPRADALVVVEQGGGEVWVARLGGGRPQDGAYQSEDTPRTGSTE
jgi:thiamine biosynthesis lipoprotein